MRNTARSLASAAIGAAAIAAAVAGCSSSSSSSADASSSGLTPTSVSNAPVVGEPQLPAATSVPASKAAPTVSGENCGLTRGPDGALKVVIFPGSHVSCTDATSVATAFGPKMASGTEVSVHGWECGPSQIAGVLAKCTKGSDTIGFLTD